MIGSQCCGECNGLTAGHKVGAASVLFCGVAPTSGYTTPEDSAQPVWRSLASKSHSKHSSERRKWRVCCLLQPVRVQVWEEHMELLSLRLWMWRFYVQSQSSASHPLVWSISTLFYCDAFLSSWGFVQMSLKWQNSRIMLPFLITCMCRLVSIVGRR